MSWGSMSGSVHKVLLLDPYSSIEERIWITHEWLVAVQALYLDFCNTKRNLTLIFYHDLSIQQKYNKNGLYWKY